MDAYGGYAHLATADRMGGDPLRLAFCWAHGRRKLIKATPKSGSPIVDEALVRIAALYKIEDSIRAQIPNIAGQFDRTSPSRWWTSSSPGWQRKPSASHASLTSEKPWPIC
ncbi:hypothetical protein ACVMB2_003785 [Sinorhizobium meliloti]